MSRYLLLIENEGKTFYKEVLTYSDRSFLVDYKNAREQGHVGAWKLTSQKRTKPAFEDIRRITKSLIKHDRERALIRSRLRLMNCEAVRDLKVNQLQTYYNFLLKVHL